MRAPDAELARLARRCGVATSCQGADDRPHPASPDVVVAVLEALGVPAATPSDVRQALAAGDDERRRTVVEPVVVHRTRAPQPVTVALPAGVPPDAVRVTLVLEDGTERPLALGDATDARRATGARARYQLDLAGPDGSALPPGYHRLQIDGPGVAARALVLAAPPCPSPRRGWVAFLPLHALRTAANRGVGTYTDLGALARWTTGLGAAMVGTLPLFPVFDTPPLDPSPYRPVTRLGYNELHLDLTRLPGQELAGPPPEGPGPGAGPLVDWDAVAAQVRRTAGPVAEALFAQGGRGRDELEAFAAARPELAAYARFRAAREGEGEAAERSYRYHLYAQWAARSQLSSALDDAALYADLPIGCHPDGFDPVWADGTFADGVTVGAPPDLFFRGGQDWAFRPLHPERIRRTGYRYLVAALRRSLEHADCLRIDHVMGLHRLYWIPAGHDARSGAYVRYRSEELRAVVAIEAHRAGAAVVGEDLGTVLPEVRPAMAEDGMLRSWVLQFESTPADPLPDPPRRCLASLGTHDLPRFTAFRDGADLDEREAAGDLDPGAASTERMVRARWRAAMDRATAGRPGLLAASLEHLAAGPADLVLVDLEEAVGERQPQNRPGTGPEAGNWRRRAARTLESLQEDPGLGRLLAGVDNRRRRATDKEAS